MAAPSFGGLAEALPAPGAAILRWERAGGDNAKGSVTYLIHQKAANGWDMARPVAEVKGNEWVLTGLQPGRDYEYMVRARDASGTDGNTRSLKVRPTDAYPAAEFRGAWVQRFEWTRGGAPDIQRKLSEVFSTMGQANLNAVVFQVRGQGDTLFPSAEEPWSPLLSSGARSIDPVAFAIAEARKNGIEFHAWMNLSVIWQAGDKKPPADRRHPFYRFADTSAPGRANGVLHDASGKPRVFGDSDYVWLTHGNPEVNAYVRRQVMNFLEKYQVQGLHWDDRTGNPHGISRDPVSVARFAGRGNPNLMKDYGGWQRDQLTRFLRDVYVQAKAKDTRLLITASPFGIADKSRIPGYSRFNDCGGFGVEPERWLRLGVLDALMPQVYWDLPDPEPNVGTLARDWVRNNKSGRPIWLGSALGKYGGVQPLSPMQVRYVALSRALGMNGNLMYHFSAGKPEEWIAAGRQMYPRKATVPVPAHMAAGRAGQLMGYVVNAEGKPLVDAWISLPGDSTIYLSSADGFFGIPNLKPGSYPIKYSSKKGELLTQQVAIQADRTTQVKLAVP